MKIRPAVWGLRAIGLLLLIFGGYLSLSQLVLNDGIQPTVSIKGQNLTDELMNKITVWRNRYITSMLNIDDDPSFVDAVDNLRQQMVSANDEFWMWDHERELPTSIAVPKYYSEGEKPQIQPFDPRLTFGAYYRRIEKLAKENKPLTVPFSWRDWVDLSSVDKYILERQPSDSQMCHKLFNLSKNTDADTKEVDTYCNVNVDSPMGFEVTGFPGRHVPESIVLAGKMYLQTSAPSPKKLIFLTHFSWDEAIEVKVEGTESLLQSEMVEDATREGVIDPLHEYDQLKSTMKRDNAGSADFVWLSDNDFVVESKDALSFIDESKPWEVSYRESIEYSDSIDEPPKYFAEAKIIKSLQGWAKGDHYDWRFFRGIQVGSNDQEATLHRLTKNFLSFSRQVGIRTWVAHGSLLSWYWNGMGFPWDGDLDLQTPLSDLHKLCRNYNQSMVVESVEDNSGKFDGLGRYFVDCGSSITHRQRGNGFNNIDARFIDVDSGLYVDITGLAATTAGIPERYGKSDEVYHCRNHHFYSLQELSPLVPALIENQQGYLPHDIISPLLQEYGVKALTKREHSKHYYSAELRQWIPIDILKRYVADPEQWQRDFKIDLGEWEDLTTILSPDLPFNLAIDGLISKDILQLAKHPQVFHEYYGPRRFTKYHEVEVERILNSQYADQVTALSTLISTDITVGQGLEPDAHITQLILDGDDYASRVGQILSLSGLLH